MAGDSGALAANEFGAADDLLDFLEVLSDRRALHAIARREARGAGRAAAGEPD